MKHLFRYSHFCNKHFLAELVKYYLSKVIIIFLQYGPTKLIFQYGNISTISSRAGTFPHVLIVSASRGSNTLAVFCQLTCSAAQAGPIFTLNFADVDYICTDISYPEDRNFLQLFIIER
jgi:hypothetical protein